MLRSKDAVKLFTSRKISLLMKGDYSFLHKIVDKYIQHQERPIKISELFDATLTQSAKDYKGEYFYKNTIAKKLFLNRHGEKATMLSEFRVGNNKADCVILNGLSTCYEIKTEFDSLVRLPEQLSAYVKVFDKTYVITTEKHLPKVEEIASEDVGILKLTDKGEIKEVRRAKQSNSKIDPTIMIQSLRMEEYIHIVEHFFGEIPSMSNTKIFSYCLDRFHKIPPHKLKQQFRLALKKYRANNFDFINSLPNSLISSAICYSIPQNKQKDLLDILNKSI